MVSRSELRVEGWALIESIAWTSDARHLLLTAFRSNGSVLLLSDLRGWATVLHKAFLLGDPVASPAGFDEISVEGNPWTSEAKGNKKGLKDRKSVV